MTKTKTKTTKINQQLVKNVGFDQNGGHHQLRHENMINFYPGDVDFRATATKIIKNWSKADGFHQNGGRHELRHEKMMYFYPGDVDFRAMATHFVNIFMFW